MCIVCYVIFIFSHCGSRTDKEVTRNSRNQCDAFCIRSRTREHNCMNRKHFIQYAKVSVTAFHLIFVDTCHRCNIVRMHTGCINDKTSLILSVLCVYNKVFFCTFFNFTHFLAKTKFYTVLHCIFHKSNGYFKWVYHYGCICK